MKMYTHTSACLLGCIIACSLLFNGQLTADPISCIERINVSLNHNCESLVEPQDVLSTVSSGETYSLMLTDGTGSIVSGNLVTIDHIWTTLTAKVTADSNGNSCWGHVYVEDKLGPVITCMDVDVACMDMATYAPTAIDNCADAVVEVIGESIENLNCDDNYVKKVTYTYLATDTYGNTSSCDQVVNVELFDRSTLVWPLDFTVAMMSNLTCTDSINVDGFPDISVTGVPMSGDSSLFPLVDVFCNISVDYSDFLVFDFGCTKKIMRTWRISEWVCSGDSDPITHVQTIEILDTADPVITDCPAVITVDADPVAGCTSEVELEIPNATDDCSGILEVDISYVGGFINNATSNPTVTLEGTSLVTYTVYDGCDNSAVCNTQIVVRDNRAPIAVCDRNSVVSLRTDGTAIAHPQTFDDGSFDDCNLLKTVIKRTNSLCDCDRPRFDDMDYLGEHEGHFYYLSKWKATGPWASELAQATGGKVVEFNSAAEADWVVDAALAITDSVYIGLKGKGTPTKFVWSDHTSPSYTNWATGQVDADQCGLVTGEYVILNENGEWEIVTGTDELKYIYEIDDPCGFSSRVNFCCEDAGTLQEVTLRVIDGSARYNECTATVEIQDKIAPSIACPPDTTVVCGTTYTPNNNYTSSDQCLVSSVEIDTDESGLSDCGMGNIIRTFTAFDASGSASCDQIITVIRGGNFDATTIDWPEDYTTNNGCQNSGIDPEDLPVENAYPRYTTGVCDNISAATYDDQTFSFAGSGADACAKVLRTWSITDWCKPLVDGVNPITYQQTIKINNLVGPEISNLDPLQLTTFDCNPRNVSFSVFGTDDCAPTSQVTSSYILDLYSDGIHDRSGGPFGPELFFTDALPIGAHSIIISYSDRCGNVTTGTKNVEITDSSAPVVSCKNSVAVNIQGMDLDNDPTTPLEYVAMVTPDLFVTSASHPCGYSLQSCFSVPVCESLLTFSCSDVGDVIELPIYVIDSRGNVSTCDVTPTIMIQDNNNLCPGEPVELRIENCEDEVYTNLLCGFDPLHVHLHAYSDNCFEPLEISVEVDLSSDGSIDFVGEYDYHFDYEFIPSEGEHTFDFIVEGCGAIETCSKIVTIESCQDPAIELLGCESELFEVSCDPEGDVFVFAEAIAFGCSEEPELYIQLDRDANGTIDETFNATSYFEFEDQLPEGDHIFRIDAIACNDSVTCNKLVTVECQDDAGLFFVNCSNQDFSVDCDNGEFVEFTVQGLAGNCGEFVDMNVRIDLFSNGTFDVVNFGVGNTYSYAGLLEEGMHTYVFEATACGQTVVCEKVVGVSCVSGVMSLPLCEDVVLVDAECGTQLTFDISTVVDINPSCQYQGFLIHGLSNSDDRTHMFIEDGEITFTPELITIENCGTQSARLVIQAPNSTPQECIPIPGFSCEFNIEVPCSEDFTVLDCSDIFVVVDNASGVEIIAETCCEFGSGTAQISIDYDSDGTIEETFTQSVGVDSDILFPFDLDEGSHLLHVTLDGLCGGIYECTRNLTVGDSNNPQVLIDNCDDQNFTVNCEVEEFVNFTVNSFSAFCGETPDMNVSIDFFGDGTIDGTNSSMGSGYTYGGYLEPGSHIFYFEATACGIEESCEKVVNVQCNSSVRTINACEDVVISNAGCGTIINIDFSESGFIFEEDCRYDGVIYTDLMDHEFNPFSIINGEPELFEVYLMNCGTRSISIEWDGFPNSGCEPVDPLSCFFTVEVECNEDFLQLNCIDAFYDISSPTPIFLIDQTCCQFGGRANIFIDYNSDGSTDVEFSEFVPGPSGDLFLPDDLETGNHTMLVSFVSECGGTYECIRNLEVVDSNPTIDAGIYGCETNTYPLTDCTDGEGFLTFDIATESDCTLGDQYITVVKIDYNNDGSIDHREDIITDGTYTYAYVTPEGDHYMTVEVFDPCSRFYSCEKKFTVTCPEPGQGEVVVDGNVRTEIGNAIEDVSVYLEGSELDNEMTDLQGQYAFPSMPTGGSYNVNPQKDHDHLNGVSTHDIIAIHRHILGVELLSTPYQMIAADVDRSGTINGLDLVEMRKLILGIYSEFPQNTSWRMVDADMQFPSGNPFLVPLPEDYRIYDLAADMNIDFIGVKIGDVNNTVELKGHDVVQRRQLNTLEMTLNNMWLEAGQEYEIELSFANATVYGFQLELLLGDQLELIGVVDNDLDGAYHSTNEGAVRMSFNNNTGATVDDNTIILKAKAINSQFLADAVSLSDFQNEVYTDEGNQGISLRWRQDEAEGTQLRMYQNSPNPWNNVTEVKYHMPQDAEVTFTVFDINGRMIYQEQKEAHKGQNSIMLDESMFTSSGVLYYELLSGQQKLIRKMILLR